MSTPKTLLALALLACGFAANAADKVYIANENADTVSVIDAASFKVLIPVRVGKMPHNVQLSPDGKFVWVTNNGEPDAKGAPADDGMANSGEMNPNLMRDAGFHCNFDKAHSLRAGELSKRG